MICAVVTRQEELAQAADLGADLAEIRLDYFPEPIDPMAIFADSPLPILATCRPTWAGGRFEGTEEDRAKILARAAQRASYVDLELGSESRITVPERCRRMISFHDFEGTPSNLAELVQRIAAADADVIKIATQARKYDDLNRLLALPSMTDRPTVSIGMGPIGLISRIAYRKFGAAMTYAPVATATAPGQLDLATLLTLYNCDTIEPATQLFGLIGTPTAHSRSPIYHNPELIPLGARYLPLEVADLDEFMSAWDWDLQGVSVTMPWKEAILPYLDELDPQCEGLGAVNTVLKRAGRLWGTNTDGPGALDALGDPAGRSVLLLGAGGTARTVGGTLRRAGAKLTICARRPEQAAGLAKRILPWEERTQVSADWLVNTTPIGMAPDTDSSPMPADALSNFSLVFDAVYAPRVTRLLAEAEAAGCRVVDGRRMFDAQARRQLNLFRELLQ